MANLEIGIHSKPHTEHFRETVLTLTGSLDGSTLPKLERELGAAIAAKPNRIVLETAAVTHIHGAALECLLQAHRDQAAHHGDLVIVNRHEVLDSGQFRKGEIDGIRVLRLRGHLDIRGVSRIEAGFLDAFEATKPLVVVDFSGADSISSLGIRMLLKGIKNGASRGGRTLLLNPSAPVSAALETAGLGQFIARGDEVEILGGLRER